MPTKNPRFTISMDDDLYKRIEDYRYTHRMKSQTQAVIALMRSGLESLEEEIKSSSGPAEPEEEEVKVFTSMVSQLSDEHKRFLAVVIQALIELEQGQLDGSQAKADKTE